MSKHWADFDGMVSVLRPNGCVSKAPPGTFGAITNAHSIKLGSPWGWTFEAFFNTPDSEMSDLVAWLLTLEERSAPSHSKISNRLLVQPFPDFRRNQLARCVASLVARSPCTRYSAYLALDYFRQCSEEMLLGSIRTSLQQTNNIYTILTAGTSNPMELGQYFSQTR